VVMPVAPCFYTHDMVRPFSLRLYSPLFRA
jgi:hypothetical protein